MDIEISPAPADLKNPIPRAPKPPSKTPAGWWSISELGAPAGVLAKLAASNIPDRWKAVLQSELIALDPKFNHVELDAHYQAVAGRCNLHLTISPYVAA